MALLVRQVLRAPCCDVGCWHIASFRRDAAIPRFGDKAGRIVSLIGAFASSQNEVSKAWLARISALAPNYFKYKMVCE
jgi:hypothetical protein